MKNRFNLESWKKATENLNFIYLFRLRNVLSQSAKHFVSIQNNRYEIQTAIELEDLQQILKLRPFEKVDSYSDHVIIRDKKTNGIVGGFRMTSTRLGHVLACESVFDLSEIKATNSGILEMSRLFLFPEHRHCDIINLVSQFLSQYILKDKSDYLVCSQSLNSGSSRSAVLAHKYFSYLNAGLSNFNCGVRPSHEVPNFQHWKKHFKDSLSNYELDEAERLLSPLFKESLKLGAVVNLVPAIDKSLDRIDFLTILHKEDLNKALWKKSSFQSELPIAYFYS